MIRKRSVLTLLALCSIGLTAAVTLLWNAQLSGIIDKLSAGRPLPGATVAAAIAAMLALCAANCASTYMTGYACEYMTHDLRLGYARRFTALSVAEIEELNAGEQLSKLQNEIAGVSDYIGGSLFQLVGDAVRFVSTFTWLLFVNPALTLASNLPAFLILAYVFWSSGIIGAATRRSLQARGQMNRHADTLLTLFPVVRLYGATRLALEGYRGAVAEWERHTIRSERTAARLMSLSGLLSSVPLYVLFFVGGHMIVDGALTVGTLYVFINLSGNVSGVLMNMPRHIASFRQFAAGMRQLEDKICL